MRKIMVLIIGLGLGACGQQANNAGNTDPALTSSQTLPASKASLPANQQVSATATLVDTPAKLPACDQTIYGELVYIKSQAQFEYCDDTSSQWTVIDLRGAKGDTGAQGVAGKDGKDGSNGKDGINGANGANGAQGIQGVAGTNGTNAKALEATEWIDPVTNLEWVIGTKMTASQASNGQTLCAKGARSATVFEFQSAYLNGIMTKFAAYASSSGCGFIGSATDCYDSNGDAILFSSSDLTSSTTISVLCVIAQ